MGNVSLDYFLQTVKLTVRATQHCFLMTRSLEGSINSRLMEHFPLDPDLTLWLGTKRDSRKVQEIEYDNRVTAGFHDLDQRAYVSLVGVAQIVMDKDVKQRYWRTGWHEFYPDGPTGNDYALICVTPFQVEVVNHAAGITAGNLRSLQMPTIRWKQELNEWIIETYAE